MLKQPTEPRVANDAPLAAISAFRPASKSPSGGGSHWPMKSYENHAATVRP